MAKKKKYVYFFGAGKAEGNATMKEILGGKGANLAEMTINRFPVPAGFTITTEVCDYYYKNGRKYPSDLEKQIDENLKKMEKAMGAKFGDDKNPLLVSVRSGAAVSMPGMMDTVLNLGLTPKALEGFIKKTKNERLGWDAYRRFINMFGDVVMNISHEKFEHAMDAIKKKYKVKNDTDLSAKALKELCDSYMKLYKKETGEAFPTDPKKQLLKSINAVVGSWNNERAIVYRKINDIKGLLGTAVNVQAMVYGNMGDTSGTGVCFTRNPATGENKFYGEFLMNAQGEDVVAGIRTPEPIINLKKIMPKVYKELVDTKNRLEKHYKEIQDFEFTIQEGKLYMLQTRNGKRTGQAAIKMAVDMVQERLITKQMAVSRVEPDLLDQLLHPVFDTKSKEYKNKKVIGKGLPASPGATSGQVVFSAKDTEAWAAKGKQVILCRIETSPEDVGGMHASVGILTARGGMTSHAAVVARGMGKTCVSGCEDVKIDYKTKKFVCGGKTLKEGDWISLNGSTGEIILGHLPTVDPELTGDFGKFMTWVDEFRKLGVRTNADTPEDSGVARKFGAEGIGLCRTEHMFFEGKRIVSFRRFILAAPKVKALREELNNLNLQLEAEGDANKIKELKAEIAKAKKALAAPEKQFNQALKELLPLQRKDFEGIFKAMKGLPVTIRTLDPPLHEFLPNEVKDQQEMAKTMNVSPKDISEMVELLHEFNPMLGHRGCRLGITYPEITEMQARAIFEAAVACAKKGIKVFPEVMIPLVGNAKELGNQKSIVTRVADEVMKKSKKKVDYMVGTMIEVPRGALTADEVAEHAQFFSFGTNDLTQMTLGFSRDDSGNFIREYVDKDIYEKDPFQSLDTSGVGKLVDWAVCKGRSTKKNLKCGVCGEHGGDPQSIHFCHKVGLNYVSCSPFRVPIARLAAAQAAIKDMPAKKGCKTTKCCKAKRSCKRK